jgi:hypothetical protein
VNHSNAPRVAGDGMAHELVQRTCRLLGRQAMQIDFTLDPKRAAAQLPKHSCLDARPMKEQFVFPLNYGTPDVFRRRIVYRRG